MPQQTETSTDNDYLDFDEFPTPSASTEECGLRKFKFQAGGANPFPRRMSDKDGIPKIHILPCDGASFLALDIRKTGPEEIPAYARGRHYNRYTNILPNPITQVRLEILRNDIETEYVNANYVRAYGHKQARGFIAAQAPTERTAETFVRMIWETGPMAVVMLTGLRELGKEKCAAYFPTGKDKSVTIGDFEITVVARTDSDFVTVSNFSIRRKGLEHTQEFRHFWCKAWKDHDVPTGDTVTEQMLDLVLAVRAYRYKADGLESPLLVHCSAGVGRTGTFILIDQVSILPVHPLLSSAVSPCLPV